MAFFIDRCNDQLKEVAEPLEGLSRREKLHNVVRRRLELVLPYESSWAGALSVLAKPYNVARSLTLLHATADEILFLTGDDGVDLGWYTKRALMGGIYASAELHMLSDQSHGKADTFSFVERRIDDFSNVIQRCSQVSKLF